MERQLTKQGDIVYHFNATCEMAIGNGIDTYSPPEFLRQFELDLELIPSYLAKPNDVVLLNSLPSDEFKQQMQILLPKLPEFSTMNNLLGEKGIKPPIQALEPWGWSPAEHRFLQPLKAFCSNTFLSRPNAYWHPEHKYLYGREMALSVLLCFLELTKWEPIFISQIQLPVLCTSPGQVESKFIEYENMVIKAPWSSSGRGVIVLKRGDLHQTYKQWINGVLKRQGYVMVEPYLEKKHDLSFHFEVKAGEWVRYLGQASFSTTDNGQYIGNNIQALPMNMTDEERLFCNADNLKLISETLKLALKKSAIYKKYTGVLGVDVLLFKDGDGHLKFQPCLEINLRNNMGTMALAIRDLVHEQAQGGWQIKFFDIHKGDDMLEFDKEISKSYPVELQSGKLIKGYLPLTEPNNRKKFMAYLLAE